MARVQLTVQDESPAGVELTETAGDATNHHYFARNTGKERLIVKNGGVGSINVTIATPKTLGGLSVGEQIVAVAAGKTKVIGPFDSDIYNQSDGSVNIDLSGASSVVLSVTKSP
jgi:hypothetical protein